MDRDILEFNTENQLITGSVYPNYTPKTIMINPNTFSLIPFILDVIAGGCIWGHCTCNCTLPLSLFKDCLWYQLWMASICIQLLWAPIDKALSTFKAKILSTHREICRRILFISITVALGAHSETCFPLTRLESPVCFSVLPPAPLAFQRKEQQSKYHNVSNCAALEKLSNNVKAAVITHSCVHL